jgi:hypothetical protein
MVAKKLRVLTTSARKPPLRTDKFAALWRIAAPEHPIRRSNCAESGYCELIRPRKGLTSNNEAAQRAENCVVKTAKAQSLPQNTPILTEVFGPMWLARVMSLLVPLLEFNQQFAWPIYWYPYYPYDYSYLDYGPDSNYQYWDSSAASVQPESFRPAVDHGPVVVVINTGNSRPMDSRANTAYVNSSYLRK